ncbi:MAG: hypothetical protein IJC53_06410 [Clostridia bacterium]|nr:hypothetical protein [Clostridia bacterium]
MKKLLSLVLFIALLLCIFALSGCAEAGTLSAEELSEIENTLNSAEYNGFVGIYFESPEEVSYYWFFYDGAGIGTYGTESWSKEEEADVLAATGWDAYYNNPRKLPGAEVDQVLRERFGISRRRIEEKLRKEMHYIEKYDAYYLMHGDMGYEPVCVTSGERLRDGTYVVRYTFDTNNPESGEVTLQSVKTGFRFVSNKKVQPARDVGEPQTETQEFIAMEGKPYQSFVSSAADLRYVFVSAEEYDMQALWDWIAVGTEKVYSLDLLGKMDEGRK